MRLLPAVLVSLSLTAAAFAQTKTLSDGEALHIINTDWNALNGALWIGERRVTEHSPPGDCRSELISVAQYDFLLNAERAGLVTINYWDGKGAFLKERDYTNKEKIEFFLIGRMEKMTIIPTKEAQKEQLKLEINGRTGCMFYKVGTYRIDIVTANKPLRKGTTDLAAVTVLYNVSYAPIYEKTYTAGKVNVANRRKANVLFRFDPSSKRWHIAAFDAANADEEIKPANIPAAYERIQ